LIRSHQVWWVLVLQKHNELGQPNNTHEKLGRS